MVIYILLTYRESLCSKKSPPAIWVDLAFSLVQKVNVNKLIRHRKAFIGIAVAIPLVVSSSGLSAPLLLKPPTMLPGFQ